MHFAIAGSGRSGRLALRGRHEQPIDIACRIGRDKLKAHDSRGPAMTADNVTTHLGITYANHDGVELQGDLYLPKGAKAAPALVAVHGGGWVQGVRAALQYCGPYLAARGYALVASSYLPPPQGQPSPQRVH